MNKQANVSKIIQVLWIKTMFIELFTIAKKTTTKKLIKQITYYHSSYKYRTSSH